MKEITKNVLKGVALGGTVTLYGEYKKYKDESLKKWRLEHPGIAIKGEKVRALDHYIGWGDYIRKGDVYTVKSYHNRDGGYYSFLECPPEYDGYVGETCSRWFPAELFEFLPPEGSDNID